jgi:hypothetical protein|tara:strand:- start:4492 stop:5022 length:531 start_codon:yes stop_codon:yes gene_type:complete
MNKYRILLMEDNNEKFDESWINEFEEEDKQYEMFFPEENTNIKINLLYVNKRNELEKISEKSIQLCTPNKIKKEELIKVIKENEKLDKRKYKLISILVYNLTLKHEDLKNFLKNSDNYNFMTNLKNIDDYGLESSINCLQNINTLFILFNEDTKKIGNNTRRVKFSLLQGKTRRKY